MWLAISYDLLKNRKVILITTFVMIMVYQAIIYFHPANQEWMSDGSFTWGNLLHYLFIDQFIIESIGVVILAALIRAYGQLLKLNSIKLSIGEIFLYELKFLPILSIAFFFFGPITLTSRFLLHYWPDLNWDIYFEQYFYSVSIYLNYLPAVLLIGYTLINVNLIAHYNQQLGQTQTDLHQARRQNVKTRLFASDEFGDVFLEVDRIIWVERENRKTLATTLEERYRLKESISELEDKLNGDQFVRINRSAIVNLSHVSNYAFWENDKYILRLSHQDKEFVMSRDRLNKIKGKLVPS